MDAFDAIASIAILLLGVIEAQQRWEIVNLRKRVHDLANRMQYMIGLQNGKERKKP